MVYLMLVGVVLFLVVDMIGVWCGDLWLCVDGIMLGNVMIVVLFFVLIIVMVGMLSLLGFVGKLLVLDVICVVLGVVVIWGVVLVILLIVIYGYVWVGLLVFWKVYEIGLVKVVIFVNGVLFWVCILIKLEMYE